jgi:hypothetical protein
MSAGVPSTARGSWPVGAQVFADDGRIVVLPRHSPYPGWLASDSPAEERTIARVTRRGGALRRTGLNSDPALVAPVDVLWRHVHIHIGSETGV